MVACLPRQRALAWLLGLVVACGASPVHAAARCEQVALTVGERPLGYRAAGTICGGQRQGRWRFTTLAGQPLREGSYADGLESGPWQLWYGKGNRKRAAGSYLRGRRTGRWTRWHENGARSLEGTYRDGLRHGRWRRWYDSGALFEDRWYVAGRREGMHWRWTREGRGLLVRRCKDDVCQVLCRGRPKRWCAASAYPPVERALPAAP